MKYREWLEARDRGERPALTQDNHEAINAQHYPGTRQICDYCGEPTGNADGEAVCSECRAKNEALAARSAAPADGERG